MLALQKAIKKIIERYIAKMIPLTSAVSAGATTIEVASTRRLVPGEHIVVYHKPSATVQAEGEVQTINAILGLGSIEIEEPLVSGYPAENSYVEKIIGFESGNQTFLEAVYLGEPQVIPRYPAITINAKSTNTEWLTLESVSHKYEIDITVYVTAADYESQYELMHAYVEAIRCSLFRSFYPLVEPYDEAVLAEAVSHTDTTFRIVDDVDFLGCAPLGWIWFESYDFLRCNRVRRYLGNGVYETIMPIGKDFSAGDKVVRPHRHFYNTLPASVRWGIINKDTMLQAAVISFVAQEESRIYVPYIDPLTF